MGGGGGDVDHFTDFEESVDEAQPIWCHGILLGFEGEGTSAILIKKNKLK